VAKQLSKHFNSREFDCKDGTKVRERDYGGLEFLCKCFLEPLRAKWGPVTINSGYRTKSHNASCGGASNSYHCYDQHDGNDQAADVTCAKGTPKQWHATLNKLRTDKRDGKGGLGLYGSFVHVDIRDYKADWKG
jgi:uncharacterized protein YcbK (DUF882 family)